MKQAPAKGETIYCFQDLLWHLAALSPPGAWIGTGADQEMVSLKPVDVSPSKRRLEKMGYCAGGGWKSSVCFQKPH